MTNKNVADNDVLYYTNSIAEKIDEDFYRLKSSYRSLRIYELFIEILKVRGYQYKMDFDTEIFGEIKTSITKQLKSSTTELSDKYKREAEFFYLGMICSIVIHTNIPIPEEFYNFGKIIVSKEDIDK